jgi:hypothetical protein
MISINNERSEEEHWSLIGFRRNPSESLEKKRPKIHH